MWQAVCLLHSRRRTVLSLILFAFVSIAEFYLFMHTLVAPKIFEFFCNLLFSAKSWRNPASIDGEEQNKKLPLVGIEPTTSRSSLA